MLKVLVFGLLVMLLINTTGAIVVPHRHSVPIAPMDNGYGQLVGKYLLINSPGESTFGYDEHGNVTAVIGTFVSLDGGPYRNIGYAKTIHAYDNITNYEKLYHRNTIWIL